MTEGSLEVCLLITDTNDSLSVKKHTLQLAHAKVKSIVRRNKALANLMT